MTNKNLTAIGFVLDRSGSMMSIKDKTINGFNEFLETQKMSDGSACVTLAQFDHEYNVIHDYVDIQSVPNLTTEAFAPRGSTALLDAIGMTIVSIGQKISLIAEDERPGNVIIVVITDGQENASVEYSRDKIFEMITHQTEVYKWEFIFLGASKDAISAGQSMGFSTGKSVAYSTDNVTIAISALGNKMSLYRSTTMNGGTKDVASAQMDYSEKDRSDIG